MRPSALLFDMDGTLTQPMLDFPLIKSELGIGNRPILEALAEMPFEARQTAEAILHRHEDHAAENSSLNPGCIELLDWLAAESIPSALITRNRRCSAETVLQRHGLCIRVLVARDEGVFKPDPTPLLRACERLGVAPAAAWMVGDGRHDIEAGRAAGMKTVWISHGRTRDFDAHPWQTVSDLRELHNLLRQNVSAY